MPPPKTAILKIRLSEQLKTEVESLAARKEETVAVIVRDALRQYLERDFAQQTGYRESPDPLSSTPLAAEPGNGHHTPSAGDASPGE